MSRKPTGASRSTPSVPRKSSRPRPGRDPRDRDPERRGDGAERHARAGDERLEQHVAGARQLPCRPSRVQAGVRDRPAGLDGARDAVAERPGGPERDHPWSGSCLYRSLIGACSTLRTSRSMVRGSATGLLDEVLAERVVGASLEREARALVGAAGGVEDVVGPQRQGLVARLLAWRITSSTSLPADAAAAARGLDEQRPRSARSVETWTHMTAPGSLPARSRRSTRGPGG